MISAYLAGAMPLVASEKLKDPALRAACQLYILGLVDMTRQVHTLSDAEFVALFAMALADSGLPPSSLDDLHRFVGRAGEAAQRSDVVANIISEGANSIAAFFTRKDADAPLDLLRVIKYAEMHQSQIVGEMLPGS